jgi:protein SCO1/2
VFRFVRDVEPLAIGDPLPDYRFTNELGEPVHLHQFHGQALAITFVFTRCPYPTFCPRMSGNFHEAEEKLCQLTNAPTNWHLLTVSFDPEFDTPVRLKAYAENYGYDSRHWNFLSGELIEVTALADGLGMEFWHDATGSLNHNLRAAVVDPQGRVQKIFVGNKWTSDDLVAEILRASKISP